MEKTKVTVCIPRQKNSFQDKLGELERLISKSNPDIFIAPEEYFGNESKSYPINELMPYLSNLSKQYDCCLIVGSVIKDLNKKYQCLLFFNKKGKFLGMEKKVDLELCEHSSYGISSKENLKRELFDFDDLKVCGNFCWEIYDNDISRMITKTNPDLVISNLKFGLAYSPIYKKVNGKWVIGNWSYDPEIYRDWLERIKFSSAYEYRSLVACSCNSWNLPKKSKPIALICHPVEGIIKKTIREGNFVSYNFDKLKMRLLRDEKKYRKMYGNYPKKVKLTYKMLKEMDFYQVRLVRIKKNIIKSKFLKFKEKIKSV